MYNSCSYRLPTYKVAITLSSIIFVFFNLFDTLIVTTVVRKRLFKKLRLKLENVLVTLSLAFLTYHLLLFKRAYKNYGYTRNQNKSN